VRDSFRGVTFDGSARGYDYDPPHGFQRRNTSRSARVVGSWNSHAACSYVAPSVSSHRRMKGNKFGSEPMRISHPQVTAAYEVWGPPSTRLGVTIVDPYVVQLFVVVAVPPG
jgi:hypothetical protein